jgi:hypothetical protein
VSDRLDEVAGELDETPSVFGELTESVVGAMADTSARLDEWLGPAVDVERDAAPLADLYGHLGTAIALADRLEDELRTLRTGG